MKFFADENIDPRLVALLEGVGHDVLRAASGSADDQVLTEAVRASCVLLTEDSDFGRLVFFERRRRGVPALG